MISDYLSKKLRFFSSFLILSVIMIHSYNIKNRIIEIIPNEINIAIQNIISSGFCAIAVPLYFMISGFLFCKGINKLSTTDYRNKMSARVRSLLIPYLSVSGIVIVFFLLIQSVPQFQRIFNKDLLIDKSLIEIIDTWLLTPIAYQLWYVRNLFLVCLISPLILYLIRRTKLIYVTILFLLWLCPYIPDPFFIKVTLTFFSIGAYISTQNIKLEAYHGGRKKIFFLGLLWVLFAYLGCVYFASSDIYRMLGLNLSIIIGIIFTWITYDYFYNGISSSFNFLEKYFFPFSFFVFLFHEPVLTIIVKILIMMLGSSNSASILIYFISPVATVFTCLILAIIIRRYIPPLYKILTGGR